MKRKDCNTQSPSPAERLPSLGRYSRALHIYITFLNYAFSRRFYPKRLTVHSGYTFFVSMCVAWELNSQPFALLTQCSTTEPQEHGQCRSHASVWEDENRCTCCLTSLMMSKQGHNKQNTEEIQTISLSPMFGRQISSHIVKALNWCVNKINHCHASPALNSTKIHTASTVFTYVFNRW